MHRPPPEHSRTCSTKRTAPPARQTHTSEAGTGPALPPSHMSLSRCVRAGLPPASHLYSITPFPALSTRARPTQKKRQGIMPWRVAPQVRLELTTLRLTAECSAIELLRIIRGLFAARCLPAARSSASSSLLHSALATASARTSLSARSALATALASLLARLPLAVPFFLMFESGKNFRSSRSLWIPATSYSPKPFPAQYHQRLEA